MDKIDNISKYMLDQHQNKIQFHNLPESIKPANIDEAYQAQFVFQNNSQRGVLGGYKIALASKIQQELSLLRVILVDQKLRKRRRRRK